MLPAKVIFWFRNLHDEQNEWRTDICGHLFLLLSCILLIRPQSPHSKQTDEQLMSNKTHRQLCLVNFCCGNSNINEAVAPQICFCGTLGITIGGLNRTMNTWHSGHLWKTALQHTARHLHDDEVNLIHLSLGLQSKTCLTDIVLGARTHDIEVAHFALHACSATWYQCHPRRWLSKRCEVKKFYTSWWFQPIWKILLKLDHLPR